MILSILSVFNFSKYKYFYIIGIYVLTIMTFSTYYYYSQNKINTLNQYKTQYEELIVKYNKDIADLKSKYDSQLNAERLGFDSYRKQCDVLRKLDNAAKHKPTRVEKLINDASKKRIECFAAATGDRSKVNDLCKEYYNK